MSLTAKVGENAAESRKRCGADRPAAHGLPLRSRSAWAQLGMAQLGMGMSQVGIAQVGMAQAGTGQSGNGPKRERA